MKVRTVLVSSETAAPSSRSEKFVKLLVLSPLIYLRVVGILFSIIVIGCVSGRVLHQKSTGVSGCGYNDSNACNFSIAIAIVAFFISLVFLMKDVASALGESRGKKLSKALKMQLAIVDAAVNGLWTLMWAITFCYTITQYQKTPGRHNFSPSLKSCANAGIAFSFFSILISGFIIGVNVVVLFHILKEDGWGGRGGMSESEPLVSTTDKDSSKPLDQPG